MTLIEKVQNEIDRKGIKLNGALFIKVNENNTAAKVFDMNYTTFNKKAIGVFFVNTNQLTTY